MLDSADLLDRGYLSYRDVYEEYSNIYQINQSSLEIQDF